MLACAVLAGLAKPRSFLYLAPVVAVLLTLFLGRQARQGHGGRMAALAALLVGVGLTVIAHIGHGTHPFKRNAVIPYQAILAFLDANESGRVLVVSTDPVIPWVLNHRGGTNCASYFLGAACLTAARYDSIFVIRGHSDKSAKTAVMRSFEDKVSALASGRQKTATLAAGRDEDAALKSRLTGVALDETILTVDLYR